MNDKKLQAKDFITIGIFTALLFVVEFACGILGFIHPYIVASYVVMIPIVGSIPMMLFYTKIEKFGMALSGGQKQRVAIASAIAAGAELLLFDEPTSGLDYAHMEKVGKLLRQLADSSCTVLVSTHDPEFIEQCCDHTLRIKNGRVV